MEEEQQEVKVEKKPSKLFAIFFMLNIVAILAGLTFAYLGSFPTKKVVQEDILMQEWTDLQKSVDQQKHLYTLVPFSANLNENPRRFVRLSLQLEMLGARGFEEVSDMGSEARDTILTILSEKTVEDIRSVQGKLILKEEIMMAVNSFLKDGIVKNAYFTEFAIQ